MNNVIKLSNNLDDKTLSYLKIFSVLHEVDDSKLNDSESPIIIGRNTNKCFIVFPYNLSNEYYYSYVDEELYLSLNLFDLVNQINAIVRNDQINKMINNWTCDSGLTIFDNVRRVLPGSILSLNDMSFSPRRCPDFHKDKASTYNDFKQSVIGSILGTINKNDKVGVLFSGGADSLLICLTLQKYNIPFICYTAYPKQMFDSAIDDRNKAVQMAARFGWDLRLVEVDFESHDITELDDFISLIPQSSHISLYFKNLVKTAKEDHISVLFSGQNMDSLYNLGPTTSLSLTKTAFSDFIRRSFLNNSYLSLLEGVGYKFLHKKLLAFVLGLPFSLIYSFFKKSFYRPPFSANEALSSYMCSQDYSIFVKIGSGNHQKKLLSSTNSIKSKILDYKVDNFLMTGAPQVIYASCQLFSIKASLPFSSNQMVKCFYRLPLGIKDVVHPKYFVYKMINDFAGVEYSSLRSTVNSDHIPYIGLDYQDWCKNVLPNTLFGKSLYSLKFPWPITGSTPAQSLMSRLSCYWLYIQLKKLK